MTAFLRLRKVRAGYGDSTVLHGVDLDLEHGSVLALLGRNGAGKTTLVHTVMGMLRPTGGHITLDGQELAGRPANLVARAGVAIVPQGRRVFAGLTVEDNLRISVRRGTRGGDWTIGRVYDLMPRLVERRRVRAGLISGGEQQMLAIARALLASPRLLLLDEPSDGLAPAVIRQVVDVLAQLRGEGMSMLLVEQDLRAAFALADSVAVMQKGEIVHRASTEDFRRDAVRARSLLGI